MDINYTNFEELNEHFIPTGDTPIPMAEHEEAFGEACDCVSHGSYYAEDVELSFCNNCDNVVENSPWDDADRADNEIKSIKENF